MNINHRLVAKWQIDISFKVNAFHAAGECRRQGQQVNKICKKNVEIVEFHDHIWNNNEKCIQKSTNMPGIGSVNREIAVKMSEMWESKHDFA